LGEDGNDKKDQQLHEEEIIVGSGLPDHHIITSCFQKLIYKFLKAYLVLCPVNQPVMY
jgi:hypothetical protein